MDAYYKSAPTRCRMRNTQGRTMGRRLCERSVPGTSTYWCTSGAIRSVATGALMIFNDGQAFKHEPGDVQAHHV